MSLKAAGRPKIKSKVEGDIFVDGRKRMNAFFFCRDKIWDIQGVSEEDKNKIW